VAKENAEEEKARGVEGRTRGDVGVGRGGEVERRDHVASQCSDSAP